MQKQPIKNDEKKLLKKAKAGDQQAFTMLVNAYQAKVMKIIGRYVYDYTEIQDLTQETFLKAFNALDKFRGDSQFYTWLYRIAINTAKNYLIQQGHKVPTVDVEIDQEARHGLQTVLKELAHPESELLSEELQVSIFDMLETMPDELKLSLMLREVEGLSYEDIADVMDCPVGTVRSRIFRARELLHEKLGI